MQMQNEPLHFPILTRSTLRFWHFREISYYRCISTVLSTIPSKVQPFTWTEFIFISVLRTPTEMCVGKVNISHETIHILDRREIEWTQLVSNHLANQILRWVWVPLHRTIDKFLTTHALLCPSSQLPTAFFFFIISTLRRRKTHA